MYALRFGFNAATVAVTAGATVTATAGRGRELADLLLVSVSGILVGAFGETVWPKRLRVRG